MDIIEQINKRYTDNYLNMTPIPVCGTIDENTEILKAYLGTSPCEPFYGDILAIIRYKNRFFNLSFHVWSAGQPSSNANRLSGIDELFIKTYNVQGQEFPHMEQQDTGFGQKAFWLYTPNSELNTEELALRAVAKKLKAYSVQNKLCYKFRKSNKPIM